MISTPHSVFGHTRSMALSKVEEDALVPVKAASKGNLKGFPDFSNLTLKLAGPNIVPDHTFGSRVLIFRLYIDNTRLPYLFSASPESFRRVFAQVMNDVDSFYANPYALPEKLILTYENRHKKAKRFAELCEYMISRSHHPLRSVIAIIL